MAAEKDHLENATKSNISMIDKMAVSDKGEKSGTRKSHKAVKPAKSLARPRMRTRHRAGTEPAPGLTTPTPTPDIVDPMVFVRKGSVGNPSMGEVRDAAKVIRARKELNRVHEMRLIHTAVEANTSQDDIAALLGTSQPTISRITHQIKKTPSLLHQSPSEIINQRVVGDIDTETMMDSLTSYAYSPAGYDPAGSDGFVRGDWRQIENALTAGLITGQEYERVARATSTTKPERAAR